MKPTSDSYLVPRSVHPMLHPYDGRLYGLRWKTENPERYRRGRWLIGATAAVTFAALCGLVCLPDRVGGETAQLLAIVAVFAVGVLVVFRIDSRYGFEAERYAALGEDLTLQILGTDWRQFVAAVDLQDKLDLVDLVNDAADVSRLLGNWTVKTNHHLIQGEVDRIVARWAPVRKLSDRLADDEARRIIGGRR